MLFSAISRNCVQLVEHVDKWTKQDKTYNSHPKASATARSRFTIVRESASKAANPVSPSLVTINAPYAPSFSSSHSPWHQIQSVMQLVGENLVALWPRRKKCEQVNSRVDPHLRHFLSRPMTNALNLRSASCSSGMRFLIQLRFTLWGAHHHVSTPAGQTLRENTGAHLLWVADTRTFPRKYYKANKCIAPFLQTSRT